MACLSSNLFPVFGAHNTDSRRDGLRKRHVCLYARRWTRPHAIRSRVNNFIYFGASGRGPFPRASTLNGGASMCECVGADVCFCCFAHIHAAAVLGMTTTKNACACILLERGGKKPKLSSGNG
eukprot:GEMP01079783.1.p2 GENE.GEMP01079783.1~~GEMP01079783.1.p2  ORF type:complete len:123 (+),score=7.99 GEMP01079783.1:416-784(+)